MGKIPEKWRESVISFALDLAKESENFPKKVLALFDKHFGFRQSLFFPFGNGIFSEASPRLGNSMNNYITYGLRYGPMYDYKERVYQDDIFRYSALPPGVKGRRVVYTEDVMPFEEYEHTTYGIHMAGEDMYYQAVLYFYMGERVVATMGLFRSKEQGAFGEEERALLEYLAELVEAHYQSYLHRIGEARFHDSFELFFQESKQGAVVLNQEMTVMQANDAAKEISRIFWEQYRHNQGQIPEVTHEGRPRFHELQTMLDEFGQRMALQGGSSQTISSLAGDISVYHSTFLSSSPAGIIQTWHLMLLTCKTKELPKNLEHPYNALTQQERRIVYYLASGMKNEQIAEELHISIYTVRTHIANIYKKFEVNNKVDLLMHLKPILNNQEKA
jgi:DNA-binding CsgD family transcriptional regulator